MVWPYGGRLDTILVVSKNAHMICTKCYVHHPVLNDAGNDLVSIIEVLEDRKSSHSNTLWLLDCNMLV